MSSARRAAVVAALALALGACSDGGPRIAKEDLLRQGDALCREAQDDVAAAVEAALADAGGSETRLINEVVLPRVRRMFADVEALGAPRGDGDHLDDIFRSIDSLLREQADGDLEPAEFAERYDALRTDLADYGFEDCARLTQ